MKADKVEARALDLPSSVLPLLASWAYEHLFSPGLDVNWGHLEVENMI